MARSAMKPCSKQGCPNLTKEKFCEDHQQLNKRERTERPKGNKKYSYDENRPSAAKRGYDRQWRAYREEFLKRNPTCSLCGAKATVVDHRIPHKGNKGLFWTRFNHWALCKSCHDRKTAKHDGGFNNPIRKGEN